MKLLDGRTVTEIRKFSFTAAEVTALSATDVVASIAVPGNTLITSVFIVSDDLDSDASPTLEIDVGFSAYKDFDGDTVAADASAIANSLAITETGGEDIQDTLLMIGADGVTLEATVESTAATGDAGDIRIGYTGVAVPSGS